jgi:hypothetical protein
MKEKIYLGRMDNQPIYITKHSWVCDWYWSFGYLGNENIHFHIESLLENRLYVDKIFIETKLTQGQWWIIKDLFIQCYRLAKVAETFRHGGYQTKLKGVTDIIESEELENLMNHKLEILLDKTWEYLEEILG